jgi:hypothetical protein
MSGSTASNSSLLSSDFALLTMVHQLLLIVSAWFLWGTINQEGNS